MRLLWRGAPVGAPTRRTQAMTLARQHLDANGLSAVAVEISGVARRKAGSAHWRRGKPHKLVLAEWLVERAPAEEIEDTILHEVAHLLAGRSAGHGPKWKAAARRLGCSEERCYGSDVAVYAPPPKWIGTCTGGCGGRWDRHRLTAQLRKHALCPKCRVAIAWKRAETACAPA